MTVEELAAAGAAGDSALAALSKGLADAAGSSGRVAEALAGMLKGKDDKDEDDDDDDDDGDDDDDKDGDDGKDGEPGYRDMSLADPTATLDDPTVDITEFVFDTARRIQHMEKAISALLAGQVSLAKAISQGHAATMGVVLPLAQAVRGQGIALTDDTPARAITPAPRAPRTPTDTVTAIGANPTDRMRAMAKAMREGIIGFREKSLFDKKGVFSEVPAENAAIVEKFRALRA